MKRQYVLSYCVFLLHMKDIVGSKYLSFICKFKWEMVYICAANIKR